MEPAIVNLAEQDLAFIKNSGRDPDKVLEQFARFHSGFPPMRLVRSIGPQDGLFELSDEHAFVAIFEQAALHHKICKFVPASGAASRMFKQLYAFITHPDQLSKSEQERIVDVCEKLPQLAFYPTLKSAIKHAGYDLDNLISTKQYQTIIQYLLAEDGLNYGKLPKALLAFHQYKNSVRTAIEEHLVEAVHYCKSGDAPVQVHFTVSTQHQALIHQHLEAVLPSYESAYQCSIEVSTSVQEASTDTPAVGLDNQPFRLENGQLLFRPGGHGALLENLNHIDADWVFIKNVDNVVPDRLKGETYHWKKVIGGVLAHVQEQVFSGLEALNRGENISAALLDFIKTQLNIFLPKDIQAWPQERYRAFLYKKLNRPIRVCGIIKTAENTGGGPFWVEEKDGSHSLQIVETAQIDLEQPEQKAVARTSTYANITDLVCGLKNYEGQAFDLLQFRDDETGFITQKSLNGKPLKAMELPGLWNGAMADWITVLVEVPASTFNPVKSVFDLLEDAHLA